MGFEKKIDELYEKKEHRPVGVAVLYDSRERFLLVRSSKTIVGPYWYFPQGGIRRGESLKENMLRELMEELGIKEDELTDIVCNILFGTIDFVKERSNERGFSKGKAYFASLARYTGDGVFNLNLSELGAAGFFIYEEITDLIDKQNPRKVELSQSILNQAIKHSLKI